MDAIIKEILDNYLDNIEVSKGNFVVGQLIREEILYELHLCNNTNLSCALLIDDAWMVKGPYYSKPLHKVDIYLCAKGILESSNEYYLDKEYISFTPYLSILKKFIPISVLNTNLLNFKIIEEFTLRPVISYPNDKQIVKNPKLSIVTTVYNNAKLLEQTIQSVINQTNQNFEYIIKDASSTDNFSEIIERYNNYIDLIISEKDEGIYWGMEQGFSKSNGEYLQIINSDDILFSKNVTDIYLDNIKRSNIDAYNASILMHYPNKSIIKKPNIDLIYKDACINHTSLAIKKDVFFALGGFDKNLKISSDVDLTIKFYKAHKTIKTVDIVSTHFRVGGASNSYSFKQFKEDMTCRYRYSKLNFVGYYFTLRRFIWKKIKTIFN